MRVSIIIPTFNRRAIIEQTLPTVLDQTLPKHEYEVVVVVDGSTDGTAGSLQRVSSPVPFQVIEQPNMGQAAARNTGLRAATGELVLFLDDDLFCGRDLVAEHVAAHAEGNSVIFGPILLAPQSPETLATKWLRSITEDWLSRLEREGVRWPDDAVVMANSSVRRDAVLAVSGFDERFLRAREDVELGLRLWKAGLRFRFRATAVTHQLYTKTTDALVANDAPLYGASEVLLCRKHRDFSGHSPVSSFSSGGWLKRKMLEACARSPLPIDPPLKLAERLARVNSRLGLRVFKARMAASYFRGMVGAGGGWKRFSRDYVVTLPVLAYHHVGNLPPGIRPAFSVDARRFRNHMKWLKRSDYTPIRVVDWLDYCREGKPLPAKPVLITFDDAYADLVAHAFPTLREYGFPATVFVVTKEVGGVNAWDWAKGHACLRCMTVDHIRQWSGEGIDFGAHSRTHADLTRLPADALEEEVAGSGRDLGEILGEAPLSFAYPFGLYNDAVLRSAEGVFQLAFTCDKGLNGLGQEPHRLRRIVVPKGGSLLDFAIGLRLGWSPVDRLRVGAVTDPA